LPGACCRAAKGEAAGRLFGSSPEGEARVMERVQMMWAMGATGKFIWPIPDKGLGKRIHRVKAPALIVWGKDDRLVPPVYADEFRRRLASARPPRFSCRGVAPPPGGRARRDGRRRGSRPASRAARRGGRTDPGLLQP